MKMMTIEVTKKFPYRGEQHMVGKIFDVPDKFGRMIVAIGKAERITNRVPDNKSEKPGDISDTKKTNILASKNTMEPKRRGRPPLKSKEGENVNPDADTAKSDNGSSTVATDDDPKPEAIPTDRNSYQTRHLKAE